MNQQGEKIPLLTVDQLYVSPFHFQRRYDDEGRAYYVPLERASTPTGVAVIDRLMVRWSEGHPSLQAYAKLLGCRRGDVSGMVAALTGQSFTEFRMLYQKRLLDDLLRYTDLSLERVARRSGIGTHQNLCLFTDAHYHCTPLVRRRKLQRYNDAGRFKV